MNKSKDRDIEIIEDSNISVKKSQEEGKHSRATGRWKKYSDFELEISPGIGRDYPVALIHSPAGEVHETMHFPFDDLVLENALKDIQIALLQSSGGKRQILSHEEQTVRDFGQKLFDTLINGELRSLYNVSLREAERQGKGLRLKLRIKPPELASLPWEFLYDPHQADYVSLSSNTPVVRYLELPHPIQPITLEPPLRILGMTASPHDMPPLDVKIEMQRVEEAIENMRSQGLVDITWLPGQTWEDLQQAMRTEIWHIFHFIGHGGFDRNADEGLIALADRDGQSFLLTATQLGRFLAGHSHLRLVLLNSCEGARGGKRDIFSSTASILVRRGIPAVLAMQYKITDKAAIEFSRAFYLALADGMPVDAAVAEARIAVSVAVTNTIEWGTPVLYMRSPDGVLFNIQKPSTSPKVETEKDEIKEKEEITKRLILRLNADAQSLLEAGNYSEAIEKWQKVLSFDPEDHKAIEGIKESEGILQELEEKKKQINKVGTTFIAKYCYNCGHPNEHGLIYCTQCGKKLSGT